MAHSQSTSTIPLCDVAAQYAGLKVRLDDAMLSVAAAGHYILGENVKAFEREFATYCQCEFAVGVGNGTDALHLALRALDIGPGDEVITTPFTFIATTEAIGLVGATPVFVDIDPRTFNLDVTAIASKITPRTKAILPVHLYGQPCDMEPLLEMARTHNLYVVEDCAQAVGATYRGQKAGTFGDVGCFSFFPSKNLGCMGDGGMVTTNDKAIYERVEVLRRHGGRVKYHPDELGVNSRLDEMQAAILRVKLEHLDVWNDLRRRHAYQYNHLLEPVAGITLPAEWRPQGQVVSTDTTRQGKELHAAYHQYTVLLDQRDAVMQQLRDDGVGCFPYYPVPLHLQRVHANLGHKAGDFPVAEDVSKRCLSLPMFPELSADQQNKVVQTLASHVGVHSVKKEKAA